MEENNNIDIELTDNTPDPAVNKPFITALKWGAITFAAIAVMGAIADAMGMHNDSWVLTVFKVILFILGTAMGVRHHRDKELGGFISYGRVFVTSFLIGIICSFGLAVLTYIDVSLMTEAQINEVLANTEKMFVDVLGMEGDRLDEAMKSAAENTGNPLKAATGKIFTVGLFGLIVALIQGVMMKRNYTY